MKDVGKFTFTMSECSFRKLRLHVPYRLSLFFNKRAGDLLEMYPIHFKLRPSRPAKKYEPLPATTNAKDSAFYRA
jgi:hypothetical protein